MRFSTRTYYGLKAVLVLAARYGEGSVPVSQIAKKEAISPAYLEQILHRLKKKGFVKSVRGPQGGYVLAKKPSEITLETLFYVLNDDEPVGNGKTALTPETDEISIADAIFWKKFRSSIEKGLGQATLKGIIDEARQFKKAKSSSSFPFHI